MNERHRALLCLGIILLIVGLFCLFYREKIEDEYYLGSGHWSAAVFSYPYSEYAMVFIIMGVALTALSLLLPEKQEPQKT